MDHPDPGHQPGHRALSQPAMKPESAIVLTYRYQDLDLRAVSRAAWRRSLARTGIMPALAWLAVIGVFGAFAEIVARYLLPYTPRVALHLWIGAMVSAVLLFASLLFRWRLMQRAQRRGDMQSTLREGPHELRVDRDGLMLKTETVDYRVNWRAVTGVKRAKGGVVFRIGSTDHVAVPETAFGSGAAVDDLIDRVQMWRGKTGGDP